MRIKNSFQLSWLALTISLALHVWDEASHNFLAFYNSIIKSFPLFPTFNYYTWLIGLIAFISALLLAYWYSIKRVQRWMVIIAFPLAIIAGMANGLGHIIGSLYFQHLLPGTLTAPLVLCAGAFLFYSALKRLRMIEGSVK